MALVMVEVQAQVRVLNDEVHHMMYEEFDSIVVPPICMIIIYKLLLRQQPDIQTDDTYRQLLLKASDLLKK
jgi:hypothetical protein